MDRSASNRRKTTQEEEVRIPFLKFGAILLKNKSVRLSIQKMLFKILNQFSLKPAITNSIICIWDPLTASVTLTPDLCSQFIKIISLQICICMCSEKQSPADRLSDCQVAKLTRPQQWEFKCSICIYVILLDNCRGFIMQKDRVHFISTF